MSLKKKQKVRESSTSTPTFQTPESQNLLASLSSSTTSPFLQGAAGDAANIFRSLVGSGTREADRLVAALREQAPRDFDEALAKVRTAGFRGGQGRDFINQQGLAQDFARGLNTDTAKIQLDQFNQNRQGDLAAASGLGQLGNIQQGLGTQLLSLLRGQEDSGVSRTGSGDLLTSIASGAALASLI